MTNSQKLKTTELIHPDYLAASFHALVSIDKRDIVENYSTDSWELLEAELLAKGCEFELQDGDHAYFSINCSDSAYLYIDAAWQDAIGTLDCVGSED